MTTIHGMDYVGPGLFRDYSRPEFQELMAEAVATGGRRRCESDDVGPVTYIHDAQGRITHEAWANVPERK